MSSKVSRRNFLRGSIAAAGGLAASGVVLPSAVKAATGKELATLIDLSKCVGCEACVDACHDANEARYPEPRKPFPKMLPPRVKAEDWSDDRGETERLTPYNWLYIQRARVTVNGEEREITIPRRCMHCQNPPCANLCPWGAASREDNGVVRIDDSLCLGGAKCKQVCPWHIPQRQTGVGLYLDLMPSLAGNGVMYKCDRCYDRLQKGEIPACIEICPEKAQIIGSRDEIISLAHKRAKEINGFIYGEKENGGTNTIYVSPVSFEELNKVIEKGPGQPHLKRVGNTMADEDKLVKALFIAPIAAVAAGIGRFWNVMGKDQKEEK